MPGSISDYAENLFLDHICNEEKTPVATVYLALGTSVDDTGLSGEPSGNGYARRPITFNAAASRQVVQAADVQFGPVATTGWGTMTNWAIFDALTGGNCLATGDFITGKDCAVGRVPLVIAGEIIIQFSAGAISNTWAHHLLSRFFRNITTGTGKPDTYVALCSVALTDETTEIAGEPSNDYARVQVNPNGGSSPVWNLASAGVVNNADIILFASPTGDWTLAYMAICDALTAGNMIMYYNIADETAGSGDVVRFQAEALTITLT